MSDDEEPLIFGGTERSPVNTSGDKTKASGAAQTGSAWYAATFMVINAALGAGLLEFPYAFNVAGGVAVALSVQAVLVVCVATSLMLLAYCSEFNKSTTYPAVLLAVCGKKAEIACAVCIILYAFGTCVTFLIIIGDQLGQFFVFVYGSDYCKYWYMSREFTMSISSVVIILPLCFPRRIDFLKYTSFLGVLAVMYVVGLITAKYFIGPNNPGVIKTRPDHFMDVFAVVPSIFFSYQCHVSIVPIYSCLKDRNLKNFAKTISVALLLCIVAYTGAASFGFYAFGDKVDPDILKSYTVTTDVIIAVFMIAAKTYSTYPILCFCGRTEVAKLWVYGRRLSEAEAEKYELPRRIIVTCIWFAVSLLLAVFIPNIAIVINVCGGLASAFILVFPGMCLLMIATNYVQNSAFKRKFLMCVAVFFIVLGTFIFGLVVTQAIMNDVKSTSHSRDSSVCS